MSRGRWDSTNPSAEDPPALSYLQVSSGLVGQLLLEQLTEGPVLPLQVKHQHLQLDALLPQVLVNHITIKAGTA